MSIVRVPFSLTGGGAAAYVPAGAIWLDGSSDGLSITWVSTPDSSTQQTYSWWEKRSKLTSSDMVIFGTGNGVGEDYVRWESTDKLQVGLNNTSNGEFKPSKLFRDPTAWVHHVLSFDTGNGTQSLRVRHWSNGVEDTNTDTDNPSLSYSLKFLANGDTLYIGYGGGSGYNGTYLADFVCLDGTAVTDATSFGEFDAKGNWVPIDPSGLTFGTNGFWLDFADSADFGKDVSTSVTKIAASGSYIGDMTGDGGLSAGFNNIWNNAADGPGSPSTVTNAYIGQDHGSGVTKTVTGFHLYGPTNGRIYANATNGLYLYGSNSAPANGTDGTILWSGTFDDSPANSLQKVVNSGITTTTAYRYHWLYFDFTSGGPATCDIGELQFFEGGTDLPNSFFPISMSAANSTSDRPADDAENDLGNYNTVSTLFTREVNSYSSPAGSITTSNGNLTVDFQNGGANPLCITTQVLQPGKKYHFEWTTDVWGSDALTYVAVWLFPEKALKNTTDINAVGVYHYNIYTWNPSRGIGSSTNFNGSSLTSISASDAWGVGEVLSLDIDMSTVGSTTVVAKLDGVTLATDSSLAFLDEPYVICPQVQSNAANRTWKGTFNFGASAFATTPLTDHVGVYTSILPAPTITDPSAYFKALLWTGDSSSPRSITGFTDGAGNNVTPDLVWLKGRTGAGGPYSYHLYDVVRGFGSAYSLRVDDTSVEGASGTANGYLDSVIAGGFSVTGGSSDDGYVNENGWTYVAWCLKAGGAGSANTDGDISSTVSVADHSGFSIVTWTGDGSNDNRVGHGMGQTPQIVIYKRLSSVSDWYVTTTVIDGSFDVVFLNTTAAKSDIPGTYTAPTSTTITNYGWGVGQDMVAYCFARVPGLIGIGSYKGNGSADGPYVVVDDGGSGFRPAFLLIKNINDVRDWQIYDNRRPGYNVNDIDAKTLQIPTLTETNRAVDFTANGFKPRTTAQEVNNNGNTFIYLAFAEYPFGGDGVAQAKAR
jgi:hypothetical protein